MKSFIALAAAVFGVLALTSSEAMASPAVDYSYSQADLAFVRRGIKPFCQSFTSTCGKLCGSTGTITSQCKQKGSNVFAFGCQCNGGSWQTANTINTILGYNAKVNTVTSTQTNYISTKTKTVAAAPTPNSVQKRASSAQNFCASYTQQCSDDCTAKNSTPADNVCSRIGVEPDYYEVKCTCTSGNVLSQHALNDMVANAPQDTYTTTVATVQKTLTVTTTKSAPTPA